MTRPINRLPRPVPIPDPARARPQPNRERARQTPESALTPPVPDEVLQQLAVLTHVHPDQNDYFFGAVRMQVQAACDLSALVKRRLTEKNGEALLRAALALFEVLGNLNNDERKLIEWILADKSSYAFSEISGEGLYGLRHAAYQIVVLFSLAAGKPHPGYPHEARQTRQRGRRPGTKKNSIFQNFVCALIIFTRRARGSFTLEKNIPAGTLIEAIELLAPHLPRGLVPDPLPGSTLQRLKTWCEEISIDLDVVDYGLDDLWMYSLFPRAQI